MSSVANDYSSPAFLLNEGSLPADVPGTWEDQTVNILRITGNEAQAASLVISRDILPVGVSIADYLEGELARLKDDLPDFELKARLPMDWVDGPGEALLTRWVSEEGSMDQITACRSAGKPATSDLHGYPHHADAKWHLSDNHEYHQWFPSSLSRPVSGLIHAGSRPSR